MTSLETVDITHLDFSEDDVTCEACDKAAEWRVTIICCKMGVLYCEEHFKKWKRQAQMFTNFGYVGVCDCSTRFDPYLSGFEWQRLT